MSTKIAAFANVFSNGCRVLPISRGPASPPSQRLYVRGEEMGVKLNEVRKHPKLCLQFEKSGTARVLIVVGNI